MDPSDQPPKKILKLEVSSTFEVSEILLTDPERIIRFGLEVHKGIERHSLESVHSAKLQEIDSTYQRKLAALQDKISGYEEQIKHTAQLSREEVTKLIEQGHRQRESEIHFLREELEKSTKRTTDLLRELNKSRDEDLTQNITKVLSEIQSFNSFVGVSANRGAVGEVLVYEYLSTHFSNYTVEDTSKNATSMSDLYMTSTDSRFKFLIEVKNVTHLTAVDKRKFDHDIQTTLSKINGAILFSLTPANISSRHFNIVYQHGVPVIYLSNVRQNPEMIKFGILILEELVSRNRYYQETTAKDDQYEDFVKTINLFNRTVTADLEQLEKDRRHIISLEAQYKERYSTVVKTNDYIREMVEKYSIMLNSSAMHTKVKTEQDRQREMDELKASVLKKIEDMGLGISNITQAALTKMGIKPADITRLGGIKQIKEMVKPTTGESDAIKIE